MRLGYGTKTTFITEELTLHYTTLINTLILYTQQTLGFEFKTTGNIVAIAGL